MVKLFTTHERHSCLIRTNSLIFLVPTAPRGCVTCTSRSRKCTAAGSCPSPFRPSQSTCRRQIRCRVLQPRSHMQLIWMFWYLYKNATTTKGSVWHNENINIFTNFTKHSVVYKILRKCLSAACWCWRSQVCWTSGWVSRSLTPLSAFAHPRQTPGKAWLHSVSQLFPDPWHHSGLVSDLETSLVSRNSRASLKVLVVCSYIRQFMKGIEGHCVSSVDLLDNVLVTSILRQSNSPMHISELILNSVVCKYQPITRRSDAWHHSLTQIELGSI